MPGFEFRFDIATILLASVLTALGVSSAPANTSSASGEEKFGRTATVIFAGGKGGISGGDVRSRSDAEGARANLLLAGGKGGVAGGDVRSRGGR